MRSPVSFSSSNLRFSEGKRRKKFRCFSALTPPRSLLHGKPPTPTAWEWQGTDTSGIQGIQGQPAAALTLHEQLLQWSCPNKGEARAQLRAAFEAELSTGLPREAPALEGNLSQGSPLNSSKTSFSTALFWEKLLSFFSSSVKPASGLQNIQLSKLGASKQR